MRTLLPPLEIKHYQNFNIWVAYSTPKSCGMAITAKRALRRSSATLGTKTRAPSRCIRTRVKVAKVSASKSNGVFGRETGLHPNDSGLSFQICFCSTFKTALQNPPYIWILVWKLSRALKSKRSFETSVTFALHPNILQQSMEKGSSKRNERFLRYYHFGVVKLALEMKNIKVKNCTKTKIPLTRIWQTSLFVPCPNKRQPRAPQKWTK